MFSSQEISRQPEAERSEQFGRRVKPALGLGAEITPVCHAPDFSKDKAAEWFSLERLELICQ